MSVASTRLASCHPASGQWRSSPEGTRAGRCPREVVMDCKNPDTSNAGFSPSLRAKEEVTDSQKPQNPVTARKKRRKPSKGSGRRRLFRGVEVSKADYMVLKNAMSSIFYGDDPEALIRQKKALNKYLSAAAEDLEVKAVLEKVSSLIKARESLGVKRPSSEMGAALETSSAHPDRFFKSHGRPLQGGAPGLGKRS